MTARRRIVVVGGGIAGVAAAWRLAADADVVLVETEAELGTHATGRSAATLSETSGHRVVCALARASRPFLEAPPAGFAAHPLAAPRGLLWIGRTDDAAALDAVAAVAASGVAPTARRVDDREAIRLVPGLRPEAVTGGGVWEPDARALDVAGLLAAYARGATARGAQVRRASEALRIDRDGGRWRVRTPDGALTADVVVDAAGAWGDVVAQRAGVAPLGLQPLRRTACLVPAPAEVAGWPLVMDVAGRCYFEPESGGLLLSPADEHPSEPLDARHEERDVAWALDVLRETTTLDVRHVRRAWAGLRTFAPDRVPVAGEDADAPGFCWLVGQGGAGIKTAPALAEALASIVGSTPWPSALDELAVTPDDLSPARLARPQPSGRASSQTAIGARRVPEPGPGAPR